MITNRFLKKSKRTVETIAIDDGMTIKDLLDQLAANGVTDLSKVKLKMEYGGCSCSRDSDYCYCPSSYTDIRAEWKP